MIRICRKTVSKSKEYLQVSFLVILDGKRDIFTFWFLNIWIKNFLRNLIFSRFSQKIRLGEVVGN